MAVPASPLRKEMGGSVILPIGLPRFLGRQRNSSGAHVAASGGFSDALARFRPTTLTCGVLLLPIRSAASRTSGTKKTRENKCQSLTCRVGSKTPGWPGQTGHGTGWVLIEARVGAQASEIVLGGFALDADSKVVRYPHVYHDEDGEEMWNRLLGVLADLERKPSLTADGA